VRTVTLHPRDERSEVSDRVVAIIRLGTHGTALAKMVEGETCHLGELAIMIVLEAALAISGGCSFPSGEQPLLCHF
jgi:hypothetical protein